MRIKAVLMIIVIIISAVGCKAENPQTTVEEVDLSQERKSIEAFGVVKPEEFMDIIIDFISVVKEVQAYEGQYLKLNEPILLLDMSQYEAEISDTLSELNIAELEYQQISTGSEDLNTEVNKLKNNIKYTESLYQNTISELDINKKLFEEGVISEEKYNQSKLNAEEAETIVLNHAGFTKSNVSFVKFGNYDKRGKMLYDIEFLTDSKKYSYEVDAVTGQIISYHVKQR